MAKRGKFWNNRYKKEGSIWGNDASLTAKLLETYLNKNSRILDIGCAYGRDMKFFLDKGHSVTGLDEASIALREATKRLEPYIEAGMALLIQGGLENLSSFDDGTYDAIVSQRTLHLQNDDEVILFRDNTSRLLKLNGIFCVSARNTKDFNREQMKWIEENHSAEYTIEGRAGHKVSFWSEERFFSTFGQDFKHLKFIEGEELEATSNASKSAHFTVMLGYK